MKMERAFLPHSSTGIVSRTQQDLLFASFFVVMQELFTALTGIYLSSEDEFLGKPAISYPVFLNSNFSNRLSRDNRRPPLFPRVVLSARIAFDI